MPKPKPYSDTRVPVGKSREEIGKLLMTSWRARGLAWEDDYDTGATVLRFRWKPETHEEPVVVRLRLTPVPANVKGRAPERDALRARESQRLHRVAYWWLKSMSEAVDAGLLEREAVLLPWVETFRGSTVSELLLPRLADISSGRLALGPAPEPKR